MNGSYRKRRRRPGPSKNEEKVSRAKEVESRNRPSNALGARFPNVLRLKVSLDFQGSRGQVLGSETRVFGPRDICNFSAPCPGTCGVGEFDLASKIAQVVTAGEAASEATGICQEHLYAGSTELCHCQLKCRLELEYVPQPAPEPS